ncbi:MAG: histidinol dehydrogenase [Synergistaceae bacterium]|jgi:histidinol dehydrogenase|nr:histidinol dehydrogenase [Synergistaceae bacterium]PKL04027.1 MAG: histidinol dehydrogenase [Synergistetes bacterium HGW-Synergistetes-1]
MKVIKKAKPRTNVDNQQLIDNVSAMIKNVRQNGDKALLEYNARFDQNQRPQLRISRTEIEAAYKQVSKQELADMRTAAGHIKAFAEAQKASMHELQNFQTKPGVYLGHRIIPVDSCCCYVPGGSYPLYSTALMLTIPARVAGVKRITACSPSVKGDVNINAKTLVAMDIGGADEIYAVGGAHAIAAFSYGTKQIAPVSLIVGPGNQYVTEAKRQCYGKVGIDFIAGPSEVLVIAEAGAGADPRIIAADLLAQAEHDPLAKGILVTTDEALGNAVITSVEEQLAVLPTVDIASRSWADYGEVVLADSLSEAINIANSYAPEHLEVIVNKPETAVSNLTNYGSLFIGQYTAEVFGDYASGTNHTLPTLKAARYTGGVWAGTFLKVCTHQSMTKQAMLEISGLVSNMAHGEGLIAHARAAEIRKEIYG